MPSGRPHRARGFTFVELMVVVTIIVILISMAIPIYNRSIIRAKESVLANNLQTLRNVLDSYGIANTFEIYPGTHTSAVASRFQNHVMPFFSKNLCLTGKCR